MSETLDIALRLTRMIREKYGVGPTDAEVGLIVRLTEARCRADDANHSESMDSWLVATMFAKLSPENKEDVVRQAEEAFPFPKTQQE